ncbi:MAG TPA: protein-glutamate O-methyltransferase CheR [Tepidisphaeraceae bacterium]|nr:protein-glutamate O-methyltransferase CheR [Tepidisphaeraceae bacterium]
MHLQLTRLNKYRHVVFTGPSGSAARIVNLAPQPSPAENDQRGDKRELTEEEDAFIRSVFACAGLDAAAYRPESLRRRVQACLRAVRASSILEARRALAANPSLVPVVIDAMVIGVSSFFRDPAIYDQLAFNVLPSLFRANRSPVRAWSVGCSQGQELYSIAILLAELGLLDGCYLLGTDCRTEAIDRARGGYYDAASLRNVPRAWVEKYFHPQLDRWRVVSALRTAVQWRTADVTRVQEPGIWDLILCRNMTMYLRPQASGRLWELFERALRPGGYLVLGKAERPTNAKRLSPVGPCLFRRDRG